MQRIFFTVLFLLLSLVSTEHNNTLFAASISTVITVPGTYIFSSLEAADPTDQNDSVITVSASGVVIDLAGKAVEQKNGNTVAGFNGIVINPGFGNVRIKNGVVKNVTGKGIVAGAGCFGIFIESLDMYLCYMRAIDFVGTSAYPITDSQIKKCNFLACGVGASGDAVISISYGERILLEVCYLCKNGIPYHPINTVALDHCKKCVLDTVFSFDSSATNFNGFVLTSATDCLLKNCIVKNCQGTADARGFILQNADITCENNALIDCDALRLNGTARVEGFLIDASSHDNTLTNCRSMFNSSMGTASNAVACGFCLQNNSRNTFQECVAHKNNAAASTATNGAIGFELNTCTDSVFIDCRASNQSSPNDSLGFTVNNGSGCIIKNCLASSNGIGFKVAPTNSVAHVFMSNKALKNTTQFSGFILGSTQTLTNISDINLATVNILSNVAIG